MKTSLAAGVIVASMFFFFFPLVFADPALFVYFLILSALLFASSWKNRSVFTCLEVALLLIYFSATGSPIFVVYWAAKMLVSLVFFLSRPYDSTATPIYYFLSLRSDAAHAAALVKNRMSHYALVDSISSKDCPSVQNKTPFTSCKVWNRTQGPPLSS